MEDLYTVPDGARLDTAEVRFVLEALFISAKSYVANGVLNHVFRHQRTGAKLFVVESDQSKRLTEVVGDTALWCTVRAVAADVAAAPALRSLTSSVVAVGDPIELAAA